MCTIVEGHIYHMFAQQWDYSFGINWKVLYQVWYTDLGCWLSVWGRHVISYTQNTHQLVNIVWKLPWKCSPCTNYIYCEKCMPSIFVDWGAIGSKLGAKLHVFKSLSNLKEYLFQDWQRHQILLDLVSFSGWPVQPYLTHWDKMVTMLQTTYSNQYTCMKMIVFWFNFYLNLLQRVQLTIGQHWFR